MIARGDDLRTVVTRDENRTAVIDALSPGRAPGFVPCRCIDGDEKRAVAFVLVNLEDGIPPNLVQQVSPSDLDARGEFELVSCLFQLKRMSPEDVESDPVLQGELSAAATSTG